MNAGEIAVQVRDLGEQCRPGLRWRVLGLTFSPIVAARMKSQRWRVAKPGKTAPMQTALGERSTDRPSHGEEAPCGLRRSGGCDHAFAGWRFRSWEAQEQPRLIKRLAEGAKLPGAGNEV